eukprot:TRINITY_DN7257_c0_g1_i1.p1 TRINITY_DN7257_c0_g1~~TRINITY_DN7257_c0_g1_i1.p1  ORF type:complete len:273 (+),score=45.26 TRINITY_DN7257_c0_g1_i1:16-834(+)
MYTLGVAKRIVAAYFHREKGYNFKRPEVVGWLKEMNPTLDVSQYNLPELTIHLASLLPPNPKIKPRTRRANAFKPTKSSHRGFKNTRPKSDHSVVTFGTPLIYQHPYIQQSPPFSTLPNGSQTLDQSYCPPVVPVFVQTPLNPSLVSPTTFHIPFDQLAQTAYFQPQEPPSTLTIPPTVPPPVISIPQCVPIPSVAPPDIHQILEDESREPLKSDLESEFSYVSDTFGHSTAGHSTDTTIPFSFLDESYNIDNFFATPINDDLYSDQLPFTW